MQQVLELRASNAHRWMACPGQPRAVTDMVDTAGGAADLGTVAHALLETMLRLDLPADEIDRYADKAILKKIGNRDASHILVDDEMMKGVSHALDYVRGYLAVHKKAKFDIECTLDATPFVGYTSGGTGDVMLLDLPRELVLVDYKNGVQHVEHEDNKQLLIYGLGALNKYSKEIKPDTKFRFTIVQPNSRKGGAPVRESVYTYEQLMLFAAEAADAAKAAHRKNAPRVAGDHCTFCRAAGSCKTLAERAVAVASLEFADIGADMTLRDPLSLRPQDIAKVMDSASMLKNWITAVEGEATKRMLGGKKIPGYKLVGSITHRKWDDIDKVTMLTKKLATVDLFEELAPRVVLSPSRMEKRLGRKRDGMPTLLGKLLKRITHGTAQPRVAPEDDTRKPYVVGQEFGG